MGQHKIKRHGGARAGVKITDNLFIRVNYQVTNLNLA